MIFKLVAIVGIVSLMEISTASKWEDEIKENYQHIRERCIAETGAQAELIDQINDGIFSEDPITKCYVKCLVDAFAKFNDDGTINTDSLIAAIPPQHHDDYLELVNKCANIAGTDMCDTAFQTNLCWYKVNSELHFIL